MNILNNLVDTMNGREKALIAWIVLGLIFIFLNKQVRASTLDVLKAFLKTKIFIPFLVGLLYSLFAVWLLYILGIWNLTLLKDTIFWLVGASMVLFLNTNKASRDPSLFKKMLLETVAFTVFIEFMADLYAFSFVAEFIILPVLFLVGGMSAIAGHRDEYKTLRKPLEVIIVGYGLLILTYSVVVVMSNPAESLTLYNLLTLIIPTLLTVIYIPFIYVFALVMAYESLFIRLKFFIKDKDVLTYTRWKIMRLCHFNLWRLDKFSDNTGKQIMELKSKNDALNLIKEFH